MKTWVLRRGTASTRSELFDAAWAATLTVISVAALWVHRPGIPSIHGPDAVGVVLALFSSVPLVWRRRRPIEVLALVGVASVALEVLHYTTAGGACVLVALYTVATIAERGRSLQALGATSAAILVVLAANRHDLTVIDVVANYLVFGTAWILGDNVKTRRKYVAELEDKAARTEIEREAQSRRATVEERTRIARELHDVVAHSVSVMTVQAGAARHLLERAGADPEVREAIATVESTGREALAELRRAVGVLREDGERAGVGPQPAVAELPSLVARAQDAGLSVELAIEGEPRTLPSGVDLSAYRIVQEALTNAFKHAGPAHVVVRVCYGPDVLEVQVVDDGRGAAADLAPVGSGNGLVGMRERVTLFGGELRAGPRSSGGYEVKARLPVNT